MGRLPHRAPDWYHALVSAPASARRTAFARGERLNTHGPHLVGVCILGMTQSGVNAPPVREQTSPRYKSMAGMTIGSFQILGTLGTGAHSSILHIRRGADSAQY